MAWTLRSLAFSAAALLADQASADPLKIIASIKPIHSLVAGVMEGVGETVLLVKGFGSEHSYSLRPSEARALEKAAIVFWVGKTMETFLIKPLETLAGNARVVELSEVPGLVLLPTREGGLWEAHEQAVAEGESGEHPEEEQAEGRHEREGDHAEAGAGHRDAHDEAVDHAHGRTDMHVWLDPDNATVLVDAIVSVLSEADPQNASRYRTNGAGLQRRLADLDRSLEQRLRPVGDRPYVVFHDAYQYFENRYGLTAVGAITINPTQRPGVERIQAIRERLQQLDAACVFAEPQFEPSIVDTVTEGTSARKGVLDPLGAALEAGSEQYFQLLDGLANSLVECLGPAKSG
jgi:zinc transport system substrate-binding protein